MAGDSSISGNGQSPQRVKSAGERSDKANALEKTDTVRTIGKFTLRGKTDDLPQNWWFASTAIPLLAATIGPLANVLSIAALVTKWRVTLPNNGQLPEGTDNAGVDIPDPRWEIVLNAISLVLGFFGNFCLLLNFEKRVRYIVALPATIISWYLATGILIGIIVAMDKYVPPVRPGETYSQGFWYAIIAATLYMIGSMILMGNMLGYFLGHYPQHFDLDDDQRTLILQSMMFFIWLAGGAGVFSKVSDFTYADALYFSDVTVLTIGFGDIVPTNDASRGLVFPYSVIGIIFLGLMINSIRKFASSMSRDKIVRKHQLNERERTFERTVTSEKELRDRLGLPPKKGPDGGSRRPSAVHDQSTVPSLITRRTSLDQYGRFQVSGNTIVFLEAKPSGSGGRGGVGRAHRHRAPLGRDAKMQKRSAGKGKPFKLAARREKLLLLKEEKDRFEAMRNIQAHTSRFRQYFALSMSIVAFGILWCVGAVVFMIAERRIQDLTYFQSLYFCYVSLLTIGYGDFSPKSNAGKAFFVVWSLVAIPTMTILVSDMGDTVISAINRGTFTLADWTVMPKEGVWHDFLQKHPRLRDWLERKTRERQAKQRLEHGFDLQNPDEEAGANEPADDPSAKTVTLEKLAEDGPELTDHEAVTKLISTMEGLMNDLNADKPKKYSYEEWFEFTRLIRFSGEKVEEVAEGEEEEEEEESLVEWDWIGENSPMLADVSESRWVLSRLFESLRRHHRRQAREAKYFKELYTRDQNAENAKIHYEDHQQHHRHHDKSPLEYPPHPGPRSPGHPPYPSHRHLSGSPVLSRGPSWDEVLVLHGKGRDVTEGSSTMASSGNGSGSRSGDSSNGGSGKASGSGRGNGSGGGTTAKDFDIGNTMDANDM